VRDSQAAAQYPRHKNAVLIRQLGRSVHILVEIEEGLAVLDVDQAKVSADRQQKQPPGGFATERIVHRAPPPCSRLVQQVLPS
jgi:hypothetical protein